MSMLLWCRVIPKALIGAEVCHLFLLILAFIVLHTE
jgi:hypothetical protein